MVNPPQCISTNTGTILQVTGFGTIIAGPSIFQGTFMLQLLENFMGDNQLLFAASGFDLDGNSATISSSQTVPDEVLMVSFCNSCCPPCQRIKNKTPEPYKLPEGLNKESLVIIMNGKVVVKEL